MINGATARKVVHVKRVGRNMYVFLRFIRSSHCSSHAVFEDTIRKTHNLYRYSSSKAVCSLSLQCRNNLKTFYLVRSTLLSKIPLAGRSYDRQLLGRQIFSSSKRLSYTALDVNTNVVKDVILFRYENPKFYRLLNIFAFCQFFFWAYLSHFAFTTLKDIPVNLNENEDWPWWRKMNLGDSKYRYGITFVSFAIGYAILAGAWTFTLRSVRFLVLRKGGDSITFVTYGPFGKNRMITAPLTDVSCQEGRQVARVQLPIKVKKSSLYYVLDMRGEFTNPRLFDHTAGLKRVFKD